MPYCISGLLYSYRSFFKRVAERSDAAALSSIEPLIASFANNNKDQTPIDRIWPFEYLNIIIAF